VRNEITANSPTSRDGRGIVTGAFRAVLAAAWTS
jgi:hypothetical protein